MNRKFFLPPAILALFVSVSGADDMTILPEVTVLGERLSDPLTTEIKLDNQLIYPATDSGNLLNGLPGVSTARMGGHGLDPVIRGQQQTQLNVTSNGAFIHGACPNRMDPPTSITQFRLYDKITIDRGYQSVSHGPGGSGGNIRLERSIPGVGTSARVGTGYNHNPSSSEYYADAIHGAEEYYARATVQRQDSGNYDDGNGDPVRAAFLQQSTIIEAGQRSSDKDYIRAQLLYSETNDALFPGAGMDSPYTRAFTPQLELRKPVDLGVIQSVYALLYYSGVDHRMDNFSLRQPPPMRMKVPSTSDTLGWSLQGDLSIGSELITVGTDLQRNTRLAERFGTQMMSDEFAKNALLWPDFTLQQIGVFLERKRDEVAGVHYGLRLDTVRASADLANEQACAMCPAPNNIYQRYYGRTLESETEVNPSAFLRYDHRLTEELTVFGLASFVSRTADATERALANASMTSAWVGNPGLSPEKHRQLNVGLTYNGAAQFTGQFFINSVEDFILRDSARAQPGILLADGQTIYRNIDATLLGTEAEVLVPLTEMFAFSSTLSFVRGQDEDRNASLPQIPPLFGQSELRFTHDSLRVTARTRYSATQTRVDSNPEIGTGRDVQETPGWGVVDLIGTYQLPYNLNLTVGVSNLFDKQYAQHLNRVNVFEPIEVQVAEPGRTVFSRLEWRF